MSSAWQRLAENRINEAIQRGELADVPSGAPLDLSEYFALPEGDRMAVSLLRNAGLRPPEIDLMKDAAEAEEKLAKTEDAHERRQLAEQGQSLRVALALALERRQRGRRDPGV